MLGTNLGGSENHTAAPRKVNTYKSYFTRSSIFTRAVEASCLASTNTQTCENACLAAVEYGCDKAHLQ